MTLDADINHHLSLSSSELNLQYNLQLHRPDLASEVIPGWAQRSADVKTRTPCMLDVRYGPGENQCLDVFYAAQAGSPTLVYFHGGYWYRGGRPIYSFLAEHFTKAGINFVVIGYDLCPTISISEIVQQARDSIVYVVQNAAALKLTDANLHLIGHSAGGHLVQMLMGTNWTEVAPQLPDRFIKSAIPMSALCLLDPVRLVPELNEQLHLSEKDARDLSPLITQPPLNDIPQLIVVGGGETQEFVRQSRAYYQRVVDSNSSVELVIVDEADHFDLLDVLANPDSELFAKVIKLIKA